jgi:hypothetical protein
MGVGELLTGEGRRRLFLPLHPPSPYFSYLRREPRAPPSPIPLEKKHLLRCGGATNHEHERWRGGAP